MPDHGDYLKPVTLSEALQALPMEAPRNDMWIAMQRKLQQKHSRPMRAWHRPAWLAAAAAAGFIGVDLLKPISPFPSAVVPTSDSADLAQLQAEASRLQALISFAQEDPMIPANDMLVALDYEKQIKGLDYVLSSDALSASDQEVLWQQRVRILEDYATFETQRRTLASQGQNLTTALVRNF